MSYGAPDWTMWGGSGEVSRSGYRGGSKATAWLRLPACGGRLFLLPCLALLTLGSAPAPAQAQDRSAQMAAVLRSLNWWENLGGSLDGRLFGYVYIFGPQEVPGQPGWYRGNLVTYKASLPTTTLGFAWRPLANGVLIDHGFRREEFTLVSVNATLQALSFRVAGAGRFSNSTVWTSTRSPLTPASIRTLHYR